MRDKIDWAALRREAVELARHARTTADTYPAIRLVLDRLGDGHSLFLDPEQTARLDRGEEPGVQPAGSRPRSTEPSAGTLTSVPSGRRLPGGIGYVELPQAWGTVAESYAERGQRTIQAIDGAPTCGWVVDLRRNGGGDPWPMLVAIGPVLGDGEAGAFVYADGRRFPFAYRAGRALFNDTVMAELHGPAYELRRPLPPVAVLTSPITASAAEIVVVAFRGRPHTRSFGSPTEGATAANIRKTLSDGATIALAAAWDADRTGLVYSDRITPDQVVNPDWTWFGTERDPVLQTALDWLREQPACKHEYDGPWP